MNNSGFDIHVPCYIGERFWIIAYRDRKIIQVECTGYFINHDTYNHVHEKYIWLTNIEKVSDFWKVSFEDFENECFKTKEEAERHL